MALLDELKGKKKLSRADIAALLASIGEPGKKRDVKVAAVRELNKANFQGYSIEMTLNGYQEY